MQLSELLPPAEATTAYDHIELTEEEKTSALRFAKMRKARLLEEEERKQQEQARIQEYMQPCSAAELRQHVLQVAEALPFRFVLDEKNTEAFELLCLYFSNDLEFEAKGYSLKKGICLYSAQRGTGKTVLMELFSKNRMRNCYAVVSTKKISTFFQTTGDLVILRYSEPAEVPFSSLWNYQKVQGICYDDLGDEEIKSYYGNKENVMARILSRLYDEHPDQSIFSLFHATTNLTGDELEQQYDKRVRSRMREMFNWIELKGNDRRK